MSRDYRSKINKTTEVEKAYETFSKISKGQVYLHKKSGREYVFEGLRTAKFNGEWFDMVDYYFEPDSIPRHSFSRTTLNFAESFELTNKTL